MSKDLNLSVLMDFYGDVLTDKQRNVMELYYNEDLSLAEIAEHEKISRQGVRDSIKHGEQTVLELEDKLGMVEKFLKISKMLDMIKEKVTNIHTESSTYNYSKVITNNAQEVLECLEENKDII